MSQAQHGRRCPCGECAAFRGAEATAEQLRASYEASLDRLAAVVRSIPESQHESPAVRDARAFLVEAGRTVR